MEENKNKLLAKEQELIELKNTLEKERELNKEKFKFLTA
jgi:hypothetical protein